MSGPRVACLVPYCRRTRAHNRYAEWICGPHWRAVPYEVRLAKRRAQADARRDPSPANLAAERAAWTACCEVAIEAAAGLG